MLTRLLISHLRPYRRMLALVVLLQTIQALAALYLPRLNADVIDKGVATGDTGYIWRHGSIMLLATLVQIGFAVTAVYFGSKVAMGFGRDIRNDLFHQVTGFSAREVAVFGAPSLITRITNDVQQVQMLVQMTCTLLIAAPITVVGGLILALREDVGLSWILVVGIPLLVLAIGSVVRRMVPQFRVMQERIDGLNQILREQITGIRVVRAFVREPDEARRFEGANDQVTETALRAGRLMAFMFPTAIVTVNVSSVAVLWFGANRLSTGDMEVGSLIAFLTLPDSDPDVGDDGHVHRRAVAACRGVRRTTGRGARHTVVGRHRRAPRHHCARTRQRRSSATSSSAIRAPSSRCWRTSRSVAWRVRRRRSSAAPARARPR